MSAVDRMVTVAALALLLAAFTSLSADTVAVLAMMPLLPAGTCSVIVYCEVEVVFSVAHVQWKVPPLAPTAGAVQLSAGVPPVNCAETKVGPAGSTSFKATFSAVAGPLLVITTVYEKFCPAAT